LVVHRHIKARQTNPTELQNIQNSVLKLSLVQRHTGLCLYRTLSRPILCYVSKAWIVRKW